MEIWLINNKIKTIIIFIRYKKFLLIVWDYQKVLYRV